MLIEYRCSCGFRSIFRHQYPGHAESCEVLKRQKYADRHKKTPGDARNEEP